MAANGRFGFYSFVSQQHRRKKANLDFHHINNKINCIQGPSHERLSMSIVCAPHLLSCVRILTHQIMHYQMQFPNILLTMQKTKVIENDARKKQSSKIMYWYRLFIRFVIAFGISLRLGSANRFGCTCIYIFGIINIEFITSDILCFAVYKRLCAVVFENKIINPKDVRWRPTPTTATTTTPTLPIWLSKTDEYGRLNFMT